MGGMRLMRALLPGLLAAGTVLQGANAEEGRGEVNPHPAWESALCPYDEGETLLTLARDGEAHYTILLPELATAVERSAAEELAHWLGEASGAVFAVTAEGGGADTTRFISVGATRVLAASGLGIDPAAMAGEGYAIGGADGNLYLAGGATRGAMNAVYALLEEDLDCRWYTRDTSTIPRQDPLFLPVRPRAFAPTLEIRDPFYREAFDGEWSVRNRTNSPSASVPPERGGHMSHALFVHTFSTLVPPGEYFAEHPEYFSENNGERNTGQLCVTNPAVVDIAASSVKRILSEKPGSEIISVSQNDSHPCCACAKCAALAAAEGGNAGPLIQFVNAVAGKVAKDYPDVVISTLAYLDTTAPPKTLRPAENVAIQLCTDSHAWSQPFLTIEETEPFQTWMRDWAAIGAKIHVWDYTVNFSHYLGPMPNWQVVTDSIRFFVENNARGVMLQGNYQTPAGGDTAMRCWVWGKLLWDPSLDTRALMKDFVYGYYGAAADAVWGFEQLLWDTWEAEHRGWLKDPAGGIRYPMTLFSEEFMARARECFEEAAALPLDGETRRRVEQAELQVLYAELERHAAAGSMDTLEARGRLERFERIARAEGVTHTREGGVDFEAWVAAKRALADGKPAS